jgi:hypothetical protein
MNDADGSRDRTPLKSKLTRRRIIGLLGLASASGAAVYLGTRNELDNEPEEPRDTNLSSSPTPRRRSPSPDEEPSPTVEQSTDEPRAEDREFAIDLLSRHPTHPQWLIYRGSPLFVCGPGDPEEFLYRGSLNEDGTRDGDQSELIGKLAEHGGNAIYMQAIRSHGGDGNETHNPFVDHQPEKGLNDAVLDQWETWFTEMERNGIVIYLFVYDDSAKIWETGDRVEPPERMLVEQLIDRFDHHDNLVWNVAEEGNEAFSGTRVRRLAGVIDSVARDGRLIGSHYHSSIKFPHFEPGSSLNHFSMQYTTSLDGVHEAALEARSRAESALGEGYQVIYAESTEASGNDPDAVRRYIWNIAMAGVMPLRLGMHIFDTPPASLRACRILREFFEKTDFQTMRNHDELATAATDYVLADPGRSYIAYSRGRGGALGIDDLPRDQFDILWVDCVTGDQFTVEAEQTSSGEATFPPPNGVENQCAVWVTKETDR